MNHLFREDQKVGHLECDKQNVLLCCKTTLSLGLFCVCVMSTLWHIVCCFSLVPCCLVTGIEHAPWSWHRSTTFPSFPRPPRFHLDHSWGLYITRLARGAALRANLICARLEKAAKPGTSLWPPHKRGGSAVGMLFVRAGCQAQCPRSHFATCKKKAKCCGMIKQQGWHAVQVIWERQKVRGCHPSALDTQLMSSSEGTRSVDLRI